MSALNIPLPTEPGRRTLAERHAVGRSLRERLPRSSHAVWSPTADRPDPIGLLEEADPIDECVAQGLAVSGGPQSLPG